MVDRKSTPDILAALGASPKERTEIRQSVDFSTSLDQGQEALIQESPEQLEEIISRAAHSLVSLDRVVGRHKLIDWLDEIRDTIVIHRDRDIPGILSPNDIAVWLKGNMGPAITTQNYLIAGRVVDHPYKVDIWARIPGKQTRIDMWIECRTRKSLIKRKDVLTLVRKAVDVFYAAHADKKDFWFDRLTLVSSAPFDTSVNRGSQPIWSYLRSF